MAYLPPVRWTMMPFQHTGIGNYNDWPLHPDARIRVPAIATWSIWCESSDRLTLGCTDAPMHKQVVNRMLACVTKVTHAIWTHAVWIHWSFLLLVYLQFSALIGGVFQFSAFIVVPWVMTSAGIWNKVSGVYLCLARANFRASLFVHPFFGAIRVWTGFCNIINKPLWSVKGQLRRESWDLLHPLYKLAR